MIHKVLRDWTLSDGTLIPAGTIIGMASDAMNKDEVRVTTLYKPIADRIHTEDRSPSRMHIFLRVSDSPRCGQMTRNQIVRNAKWFP